MEDIGLVLADFVSNMENVPSEIRHLFTEIGELDERYEEAMGHAARDERLLQKELREAGNRERAGEREEQLVGQIAREHKTAAGLCQEKQRLARKAMGIVQRHLAKLDSEIRRYDKSSADKHRSNSGYSVLGGLAVHGAGDESPATATAAAAASTAFHLSQRRMDDLLGGLDAALGEGDAEGDGDAAFYTPSRVPKRRQHGARPPQRKKQLKLANSILSLDGIEVEGGVGGVGGIEESDDQPYCFCQQVSYGDMVACDGPDCRYEWFHWECVGLTSPPQGAWHCRECLAKLLGKPVD